MRIVSDTMEKYDKARVILSKKGNIQRLNESDLYRHVFNYLNEQNKILAAIQEKIDEGLQRQTALESYAILTSIQQSNGDISGHLMTRYVQHFRDFNALMLFCRTDFTKQSKKIHQIRYDILKFQVSFIRDFSTRKKCEFARQVINEYTDYQYFMFSHQLNNAENTKNHNRRYSSICKPILLEILSYLETDVCKQAKILLRDYQVNLSVVGEKFTGLQRFLNFLLNAKYYPSKVINQKWFEQGFPDITPQLTDLRQKLLDKLDLEYY